MQTLHLAHLPPSLAVHVALYTNLQNAPFLRDRLLQGDPDFEYALVDAEMIISTTHVLAAVFRAANDFLTGRLRSRNVHSEIVVALGGNNNIATSLRTFGLTPTTTRLLLIKLATDASDVTATRVSQHIAANVQGTAVEFTDETLAQMADWGRVRRAYKLGDGGGGGGGGKGKVDKEGERKELEVTILGVMALRGAV